MLEWSSFSWLADGFMTIIDDISLMIHHDMVLHETSKILWSPGWSAGKRPKMRAGNLVAKLNLPGRDL